MPRQAVSYEVGLVCIRDMWCLIIDGIISPDDRIMNHGHVAGTRCEKVILRQRYELSSLLSRRGVLQTFLVRNSGVEINGRGASAHGLCGDAAVAITKGRKG